MDSAKDYNEKSGTKSVRSCSVKIVHMHRNVTAKSNHDVLNVRFLVCQ